MAINYDLVPGTGDVHEVDPISRIEGHLGVAVEVDGTGKIVDANAHGNLWRGFENFLLGRAANDAITFVQRICGVCPVPHGMTSTYAVDTVLGYSDGHITFKTAGTKGVPPKALLIRNLVLGCEFLMSSITHFYHLAAPSYVQGPNMAPWTPYFADGVYSPVLLSSSGSAGSPAPGVVPDAVNPMLWDAVIISYVRALKIRRLTFEAGALFAGRMPMTSCYVGGGVTNNFTDAEVDARCDAMTTLLTEVGKFIVNEYVPIAVVLGALYPTYDNGANVNRSVPNAFLSAGLTAADCGIGAGLGRFLAWGGFPTLTDTLTLPGGVKDTNGDTPDFVVANKADVAAKFLTGGTNAVPANLTEDISHSRYDATAGYIDADTAYPGAIDRTKPNRAKGTAYTYMKAPRWDGFPCEVGPFARLAVAGYYPVNGATLASTVPGYTLYVQAGSLDLNIIAPTIVAGIVNTEADLGLAPGALVTAVSNWVLQLQGGLSTMDRLRARALESLVLVQAMLGAVSKSGSTLSFAGNGWIQQLKDATGDFWSDKSIPTGTVQGWGGTEAPRGALMHQCKITNGKIVAYQCIVPTTWNGSPKDAAGQNGAIEAAVIGSTFDATPHMSVGGGGTAISTTGGVEVLRVAQSFDPCIACAVH